MGFIIDGMGDKFENLVVCFYILVENGKLRALEQPMGFKLRNVF